MEFDKALGGAYPVDPGQEVHAVVRE
jgi:hypothetical protein